MTFAHMQITPTVFNSFIFRLYSNLDSIPYDNSFLYKNSKNFTVYLCGFV